VGAGENRGRAELSTAAADVPIERERTEVVGPQMAQITQIAEMAQRGREWSEAGKLGGLHWPDFRIRFQSFLIGEIGEIGGSRPLPSGRETEGQLHRGVLG
jgi:hypothetical protein